MAGPIFGHFFLSPWGTSQLAYLAPKKNKKHEELYDIILVKYHVMLVAISKKKGWFICEFNISYTPIMVGSYVNLTYSVSYIPMMVGSYVINMLYPNDGWFMLLLS